MVTPFSAHADSVLDLVNRYRLTTAEIVAGRGLADGDTLECAELLLNQLVERDWLRRGMLYPGSQEPYYFLSQRAAVALGVDAQAAHELSVEHRLERYAIARFCCQGERFRELMTESEFRARFDDLWHPGQPFRYYLENNGSGVRLAFLKVDLGGPSQWDRVINSCCRFLAKRTERSPVDPRYHHQADLLRAMVDQKRFQISLLVACPEKARSIAARLDADELQGRARPPILPYVVPGLFERLVLAGIGRSSKKTSRRRKPSRTDR